jgi:hypothetical protein
MALLLPASARRLRRVMPPRDTNIFLTAAPFTGLLVFRLQPFEG